jgi:hypothetical protein
MYHQLEVYMCDFRVVLKENDSETLMMENVTELDVHDRAVSITSLFEGPKIMQETMVRSIDFLGGKVYLQKRI